MTSKRKPNLIDTARGKEFYNNIFQNFSKNSDIIHYPRNTSLGAVFAERFNGTIRDLLKRLVFKRGIGNWVDIITTTAKQYKNKIQSSNKLTPTECSSKKNEAYVCPNSLGKRKKNKEKIKVHDLVRTADLRKKSFRNRLRLNGVTNYMKVQKTIMILYRVIALINYQNVIMKLS